MMSGKTTGNMFGSQMPIQNRLAFGKFSGHAASFLLILGMTTNMSLAAGGITCASKDGRAELSVSMARLPIYTPSAITARLGKTRWASVPQFGETELGSSQGMIEQDKFSADFADKDISKIIISLRVPSLAAGEEDGVPATLTFEDGVPRAVICQFE